MISPDEIPTTEQRVSAWLEYINGLIIRRWERGTDVWPRRTDKWYGEPKFLRVEGQIPEDLLPHVEAALSKHGWKIYRSPRPFLNGFSNYYSELSDSFSVVPDVPCVHNFVTDWHPRGRCKWCCADAPPDIDPWCL